MRILFAPDSFGDTLTAVEAAAAMAAGWTRQAPRDEVVLAPMSDGGPGFVAAMHASLGGEQLALTVLDLYGDPVPATILRTGDGAYVESSQACGLHLSSRRDPTVATTYGVGQLILAAADAGAHRIVTGLGGSGTNDAGAGCLAALGAIGEPSSALNGGPQGFPALTALDVEPARRRVDGLDLVIATDVDNRLLGLRGATRAYGPQKGLAEDRTPEVDAWLEHVVSLTDPAVAKQAGAGAAGGLGFGLLLVGARRVPGVQMVADALGLAERARECDLVVTGEGSFDFSSGSGKVPYGVARVAQEAVRPCIALAGRVLVGSREMRVLGMESAYSMVDLVGEPTATADPHASLAALAERVARSWSR
jgi:glycerate kinase